MTRSAPMVFAAVISAIALLAVLASSLGFFGFLMVGLVVAALGVVGLLGALTAGVVLIDALAARTDGRGPRVALAVFCALIAGAVLFVPMTWAADSAMRIAKRPVRAIVAERIFERARGVQLTGSDDIRLEGPKSLLSDGGEITVYSDGDLTAVWFWDARGILGSYSASVYVSDSSGYRVPANLQADCAVEHETGHWWRAIAE